jgi:hypothetical protein
MKKIDLRKKLFEHKPDTHFSQAFADALKARLTGAPESTSPQPKEIVSPVFFSYSRFSYSLIAGVLALVIIVPLAGYFIFSPSSDSTTILDQVKHLTDSLSPTQKIQDKGSKAFGTLALLPQDVEANTSSTSAAIIPKTPSASSAAAGIAPMAASTEEAPAAEKRRENTFAYDGKDFIPAEAEANVYKRTKGTDAGKNLADLIQKSDFGLAALSSFPKLSVKDIQLSQDTTSGYTVNVNFDAGTVSIALDTAKAEADTAQTLASTSLSKAGAIALANQFLKDHNVDHSSYGEPVAEEHSTSTSKKATTTENSIIVTYPLIIKGLNVYDQGGKPFGLEVVVDPKSRQVSALGNLTSQIYESAKYDLATSSEDIFAGVPLFNNPAFTLADSTSTASFLLGTPQEVLMRYFKYKDDKSPADELYVPALLFPIENASSTGSHRIIVPLVKDFLSK